jgi:GNAT superfamily N-acetyltransferase
MSSVEIREVHDRRDLRRFIRFPFGLYRDNDCWIPPLLMDERNTLDAKRNPAFRHCRARYFMAYRDGRPVGRVAAIINEKYVEKWGNRYCRFGWLDFTDDPEVSSALMGAVEAWAREEGMTAVHGPLGFTDLDREGMLIEGFDELGTMATGYNHPYYPQHLERLGYAKDVDWVEFEVKVPAEIPEKILRVQELVLKRSKVRMVANNKKALARYAPGVFDLVNETYKDLYGVVEITEEQKKAYTDQYFGFINVDYVRILIDENDRVVGFGIIMPSLSHALQKSRGRLLPFGFLRLLRALRRPVRIDFLLVAVLPEYKSKGLLATIMTEINANAIRNGVRFAETNPELETNTDVQSMWKVYEARQHKRRRAFIRNV